MMKFLLAFLLLFSGCNVAIDYGSAALHRETPTVNLPKELRASNWLSPSRSGSCTHATIVSALRWSNRPRDADWWRATHSGGETPESLSTQLDEAGIRYVQTVGQNDREFVRQAVATRRGCLVTVMGGRHAVLCCHLDAQHAYLLDNNNTEEYLVVPLETFWSEWESSNSWGLAVIYEPLPAL